MKSSGRQSKKWAAAPKNNKVKVKVSHNRLRWPKGFWVG
jgi:hypothetical protein